MIVSSAISDAGHTTHPRRVEPIGQVLTASALIVGVALRACQYAYDRSLWLDEAEVSLDILHRSYSGLAKPLNRGQAAPILWLWAERTSVNLFGNSEWALRAVPLVASLVALVAFVALARRLVGPIAAGVATVAFACSPALLRYSVEVKQYGADVACVLLIVLAAVKVLVQPRRSALVVWAATCVVTIWFSHASILAAAASACVVAVAVARSGSRRAMLEVVAPMLFIGAAAAADYALFLRRTADDATLRAYWASGFESRSLTVGGTMHWLSDAWSRVMADPGSFAFPRLALLAAGIALVFFVARRPWEGALLATLVAALSAAAVTRHYPLDGRLVLWTIPLLIIVLAHPLDLALQRVPRGAAWLVPCALAGVSLVVLAPLVRGAKFVGTPMEVTNSRGAYAFVASHIQTGDALLVESRWTWPTLEYYGPRYGLRETGGFEFVPSPRSCEDRRTLARLLPYQRFWVVLAHHPADEPADRTAIYLSHFNQIGTPRLSFHSTGDAGAYLFVTGSYQTTGPVRAPWAAHSCLVLTPR